MKIAKITSLKKRISGVLTASLAVALLLPMLPINAAPAAPTSLAVTGGNRPTVSWGAANEAAFDASSWARIGNTPFVRIGGSITSFNGQLWSIGGVSDIVGSGPENDIWSSSDGINWTQVVESAPWLARSFHSAVVFNDKLWIFGGISESSAALNDIWSSSDGINWTQVVENAAWPARTGGTSVVFDDKIWIMGGSIGPGQALSDVWSSIDGVNWSGVTDSAAWGLRTSHSSAVYNGKIWIMGGTISDVPVADAWSSVDGINWSEEVSGLEWLLSASFQNSLVVKDEYMYSTGLSVESDSSYSRGIWRTSDGSSWDKIAEPNVFPVTQIAFTNLYSFNGRLWLSSGVSLDDFSAQDDLYSTTDNSVAHYKLCWDKVENGCANSVKVSPDGNVVASNVSVLTKFKQAFLPSVLAATNRISYTFTEPLDLGKWYFSVYSVDGDGSQSVLAATTSAEVTPGLPDAGKEIVSKYVYIVVLLGLVGWLILMQRNSLKEVSD